MAKLTLKTDYNNIHSLVPRHKTHKSLTFKTCFRNPTTHLNLSLLPLKHRFKLKFCCSIKEKEREDVVDISDRVVKQLGNTKISSEILGTFHFNWKNLPQRYKMIGTTSLAFVICNMDKVKAPIKCSSEPSSICFTSKQVNLSIAIIPMSHQFGWNSSVAGLVQSSFFWGYALSQLPGGWLSKVFGGRVVLQYGVLVWSLATACVPLLAGFMPGLVLSRILVGIGEGVSPSAATDLIARLIPLDERSRAVSFVFGGLSVGSVAGLLLAPPLIQNFGWESVFYLFGLLGVAWFLGFQLVTEEPPNVATVPRSQSLATEKSNTSVEELGDSLKTVPWKAFFQSKAVWAMIYAHFCGSWGHYTCLSWLPTYFSEVLDLNLTEAAWWGLIAPTYTMVATHLTSYHASLALGPKVSVLPPLASIVMTSIAAQLADKLIANGIQTTLVRKLCQTIAFLSPAACMTLSSLDLGLPPWEVVTILTGGLALSSFALSGLYCTHQDISPEYASILLGITNTIGAVPGIVGVALTGYLLDSTHSWSVALFAPSIFFYLTGTVVWLNFASSKPQTFLKRD